MDRITAGRALALALMITAPITNATAQTWSTIGGNASHNGYVPVTLNTGNFRTKWEQTAFLNTAVSRGVAVDGGRVFLTSDDGSRNQVQALNSATGAQLWNVNLNSLDTNARFTASPVAGGGNVYVQTAVGYPTGIRLRAFDGATGTLRWTVTSPEVSADRYLRPTYYSGNIYTANYVPYGYTGVSSYNAATGASVWSTPTGHYAPYFSPAVDSTQVYVYHGADNPGLYVYNRQTGALAQSVADPNFNPDLGTVYAATPVLGKPGDAIVTSQDRIMCFDTVNGTIKWQRSAFYDSMPAVANGVIYAVSYYHVDAIDEDTGSLLWSWTAPKQLKLDVMASQNYLFVSVQSEYFANTYNTYALNLTTHTTDWTLYGFYACALTSDTLYAANDRSQSLVAVNLIPEPGCLVILACGIGGLLLRTKRR